MFLGILWRKFWVKLWSVVGLFDVFVGVGTMEGERIHVHVTSEEEDRKHIAENKGYFHDVDEDNNDQRIL